MLAKGDPEVDGSIVKPVLGTEKFVDEITYTLRCLSWAEDLMKAKFFINKVVNLSRRDCELPLHRPC